MKKTLLLMLMVIISISSSWATKYELVTSATQLVAGCKYIIADGTSGNVNVISTESNTNNRRTTTGTVSNSSITASDAMMVFELGGSSNAWTFTTTNYLGTDGYLYNNDTNNNRLFVGNNTTANKFTISFSNNAISSITCNGNTSKGVMCFNGNLVACYSSKSSSYKVPQLYKESSEVSIEYNVTISDDIQNGTVSADMSKAAANTTVTLTATPANGYKFDSWNVTNASTSTAITVTDNKFTMPAANVNVSAKFVEKTVNPNEIIYDFNDLSAYPTGFPTSGSTVASAQTFSISGNDIIINAPNAYYIINSTTDNRGLFFGKTAAANNKPSNSTAYLGFPAISGKKLVKVVATTTSGVAGSVKMNIYTTDWTAKSTELTTTSSTKKEFTFELTETEANTEYRLASGSSGKNLQFDNIVLTYEEVTPTPTAKTIDFYAAGTDGYYTTFSNDKAVTIPEAIEADNDEYIYFTVSTVWADGNELAYEELEAYDGLFYLSENEGYLIKAETTTETYEYTGNKAFSVEYTELNYNLNSQDEHNVLRPAYETKTGDNKYYMLAYSDGTYKPASLGFYWGAADGAAFTSRANSAYLALPKGTQAKGFSFADASTTGIKNVNNVSSRNVAYNLAGQRVNANTKGIVIMNGKKMLNK